MPVPFHPRPMEGIEQGAYDAVFDEGITGWTAAARSGSWRPSCSAIARIADKVSELTWVTNFSRAWDMLPVLRDDDLSSRRMHRYGHYKEQR